MVRQTIKLTPEEEAREKAYKEFFGKSWKEFELHWMTEGLTPEEAVEKLGDEMLIDYCDYCKTYYFVNSSWGKYNCPYCYHKGTYSK